MMNILKKIRLGEYLAIGWILFVAVVYTIFKQWKDSPVLDENTWLSPFFLIVLVTLCRYLVPLIFASVKNLGASFNVVFAGEKSVAAQAPAGFEDEILWRIARQSKLWRNYELGSLLTCLLVSRQDFPSVGFDVANGRIDLSKADLHRI